MDNPCPAYSQVIPPDPARGSDLHSEITCLFLDGDTFQLNREEELALGTRIAVMPWGTWYHAEDGWFFSRSSKRTEWVDVLNAIKVFTEETGRLPALLGSFCA